MHHFIGNIKEIRLKESICTHYIEIEKNRFLLNLQLTEKGENEDKIEISFYSNIKTNQNNYIKILKTILNNILADKMEKLLLKINISIITRDDFLIATIINHLCICLVKAGMPIKDLFTACGNDRNLFVYSINFNNILHISLIEPEMDVMEFISESIENCNLLAEKVKTILIN